MLALPVVSQHPPHAKLMLNYLGPNALPKHSLGLELVGMSPYDLYWFCDLCWTAELLTYYGNQRSLSKELFTGHLLYFYHLEG